MAFLHFLCFLCLIKHFPNATGKHQPGCLLKMQNPRPDHRFIKTIFREKALKIVFGNPSLDFQGVFAFTICEKFISTVNIFFLMKRKHCCQILYLYVHLNFQIYFNCCIINLVTHLSGFLRLNSCYLFFQFKVIPNYLFLLFPCLCISNILVSFFLTAHLAFSNCNFY